MRRNAWSHDVFSAALVPGWTRELLGNGNLGDTLLSSRLPSVDTVIGERGRAMSTSTEERTTWVCENCQGTTASARKRCTVCGTSRY